MTYNTHARGLTLIEILIVLFVLGVLALSGLQALPKFKRMADLNGVVEDTLSLLAEARSRTLASENNSSFGVYFQADRMALFSGTTYATTSADKTVFYPSTVELYKIVLNGDGDTLLFNRLTGATDEHGTLTFYLKTDITKTREITVLQTGSALFSQ